MLKKKKNPLVGIKGSLERWRKRALEGTIFCWILRLSLCEQAAPTLASVFLSVNGGHAPTSLLYKNYVCLR